MDEDEQFEQYEPIDDADTGIRTTGVGLKMTTPTEINMPNKYLNTYEITFLVGYRAQQISAGAPSFLPIDTAKKLVNPLLIAEEEFKKGYIPFDLIRTVNVGNSTMDIALDIGRDLQVIDPGNML